MTITNPEGTPSLLENVVCVDHARMDTLLHEIERVTPTPGAWDTLVIGLAGELELHLVAERRVVLPVAEAVMGDDEVGAWTRSAAQLSEVVDALATHPFDEALVASARVALEDHRHRCEGMLPPLRDAVGAKMMARLGFDYGDR